MPLLNEKALRRPTFVEGVKLTLVDGQQWEVPKPLYRFYPRIGQDGRVDVASKVTFGEEIEYFLDGGDEDVMEDIRRRFEIMVKLLGSNYDLSPADYGRLLSMNRTDPASSTTWDAIDRILVGKLPDGEEPPKPSADGSA